MQVDGERKKAFFTAVRAEDWDVARALANSIEVPTARSLS